MMYMVEAKTSEDSKDNHTSFYKEDGKIWISIGQMEERCFTFDEVQEVINGLQKCIKQ